MLKIKKINQEISLPRYATDGSAGMDLQSAKDVVIAAGETALVSTGLAIALEKGTEAQIRPRSGMALKHKITVLNSPGTIDSDYRGEIKVILINHSKINFYIKKGDRIAQMVITKYESPLIKEVFDLDETARGIGGFGSTGKN
ncbi:dUTP diphosphatase [Flavobacteriaceae bacterium]|nr:dUTP diphosphatase [Flavobacteriaceae bacterium]